MKLVHDISRSHENPFVIARGGVERVSPRARHAHGDDGAKGWGEAAPSTFYGETADTVVDVLPLLG